MSGGHEKVPLVIRCACGARPGLPATHTETLDGLFLSLPGVMVLTPSNARDAKGLLNSALRGSNPVIFFEHRLLYPESAEVPEDYYTLPIGKAEVVREGTDVTIVSNMAMLRRSLEAAVSLSTQGISAEVIDLKSIVPLDSATILASVQKTGSLVTVEEAPVSGGWSNLVVATVAERAFGSLKRPVKRIALQDVPIPYSTPLIEALIPTSQSIAAQVESLVKG
jgi:pyruvate dehydrogenase E1 component beta subunit